MVLAVPDLFGFVLFLLFRCCELLYFVPHCGVCVLCGVGIIHEDRVLPFFWFYLWVFFGVFTFLFWVFPSVWVFLGILFISRYFGYFPVNLGGFGGFVDFGFVWYCVVCAVFSVVNSCILC